MGATSDNYQILTSGTTYTIASDYVNASDGETAHFQVVKIAHGANDTATYASSANPLPVSVSNAWARYDYLAPSGYYSLATTIVGSTGTLKIQGICGGDLVGVTVGNISVSSTDLDIRTIYGGTVGSAFSVGTNVDYMGVQGLCGAYPVGITFSGSLPVTVSSFSNLGVFGVSGATAVGVTFGTVNVRGLTAASDTITVYGGGTASTVSVGLFGFTGVTASPIYADDNALNVNIKSSTGITVSALNLDIRDLSYTTDTVTVVGQGASDNASSPKTTVPTYINALNSGNLLQVGGVTGGGWCAAALNVFMVNSGITFAVNATATFSAEIGITAPYHKSIPVQGSTSAGYGVWVTGSTNGDPVSVRGSSGGYLPVEVKGLDGSSILSNTSSINTSIGSVKNNTDFLAAVKKALYSDVQSVGANDFEDKHSIYTLLRDNLGTNLTSIKSSVLTTPTPSIAVSVVGSKQQASFLSRTNFAGITSQNLTVFNSGGGHTCSNGIRIKTSRLATGTNASQNELMCVISEADAALYGSNSTASSYVLYHGDEMFFEVDNINKIKVFYPPLSTSFAPHNTGSGMTFSFYAS